MKKNGKSMDVDKLSGGKKRVVPTREQYINIIKY